MCVLFFRWTSNDSVQCIVNHNADLFHTTPFSYNFSREHGPGSGVEEDLTVG